MGQIFRRTYKAADGSVRTCDTWTIRYFRGGRAHQEPTKFTRKGDAERLLKTREGDVARGISVSAAAIRTTFDDAALDVVNDYKVNGKRSLKVLERRITLHLRPVFGGRRLADIGTADVRAFVVARQAAGASNGEINRELQTLKRCYSLAIAARKAYERPHIELLTEAKPRAGFFDRPQVDTVCGHLSPVLADVVRFAYITGWRVPSEVLTLEWRNVDLALGTVRLDAGTTKNGEARTFPLTEELRTLLERRQTEHAALQKAGRMTPLVFCRLVAKGRRGPKSPKPIKAFTKAWRAACAAAGCPGRIPHDLRRSAVRTFVRAGISETVAMKLSGHLTPSVFRRYDITSETDLREAAELLNRDSFGSMAGPEAVESRSPRF